MAQERARPVQDQRRDAATASGREALEHPHMLFRFQRDPLEVAMQTGFEQTGGKSPARQAAKQRASR